MRKEMSLKVSGLREEDVKRVYEFLDNHDYSYVGTETEYDEIPPEIRNMNMYDYIKQLDLDTMKRFIYWVYSCGNYDGYNDAEDSPGDCSFFGGAMMNRTVGEVVDGTNHPESYGFDWM